MSDDTIKPAYPLRPAFPGDGPKSTSDHVQHHFYDPMSQPAWQDDSFYRSTAQEASLKRRSGFPSYLQSTPKEPS